MIMSKLTIIEAATALAAVNENPNTIFTLAKKREVPGKAPYAAGAKYYKTSWKFGTQPATNGWFVIENIPITNRIAPPGDARFVGKESARYNLQTTVGVSGDFGQFISKFNRPYLDAINKYITDGTIAGRNKRIHALIRDHLSDDNVENPGGIIEDPIICFDVGFKLHPKDFYISDKAGKPKTEFFEYISGGERDENGVEKTPLKFKPAEVFNPDTQCMEPVGEMNLHLWLKNGGVIKRARLWFSSVCASSNWVSMPLCIVKVVIALGSGEVVCSDGLSGPTTTLCSEEHPPAPPVQAASQPVTTQQTSKPVIPVASDEDINAMINSLALNSPTQD
jgi:hypothetical protein